MAFEPSISNKYFKKCQRREERLAGAGAPILFGEVLRYKRKPPTGYGEDTDDDESDCPAGKELALNSSTSPKYSDYYREIAHQRKARNHVRFGYWA
jgi:hypothetical protein